MTPQRWLVVSLRLLVMVIAILALAGVVSAKAPANQIALHSQDVDHGIVLVDSVTADQDGWIVIYKRADFAPDTVVGYAPVHKGLNPNVRVTVNTRRIENAVTLWAMLHVDKEPFGIFEWGTGGRALHDTPVVQNGQPVVVAFGTTGRGPAPLSIAPEIKVKSQDINNNRAVFDSITTPEDGWLVIYKNPNLAPSAIVGHAPVYQGENSNLAVALDGDRIGSSLPTLWAVLHTDKGTQGVFEWGHGNKPLSDAPLLQGGRPVIAAFGTFGE